MEALCFFEFTKSWVILYFAEVCIPDHFHISTSLAELRSMTCLGKCKVIAVIPYTSLYSYPLYLIHPCTKSHFSYNLQNLTHTNCPNSSKPNPFLFPVTPISSSSPTLTNYCSLTHPYTLIYPLNLSASLLFHT